jgi:hypothetical protein
MALFDRASRVKNAVNASTVGVTTLPRLSFAGPAARPVIWPRIADACWFGTSNKTAAPGPSSPAQTSAVLSPP